MKAWSLRREDLMTPQEWAKLRMSLNARAELAERRRSWSAIQDRAICFLAVWAGLRRAELAALNCGDIYLTNDRPYVVVRHGKGDQYREVLLSPECRAFLKRFLKEKRARGEPVEGLAPLFLPQRGTRYTADGIYRVWKSSCSRAGIPARSIHKARHLFASVLYAATKNLRLVQKQLGHARVTTTTVYTDIFDEDTLAGMKALDKALKTLPTPPKSGRVCPEKRAESAGNGESLISPFQL
jgi:integrase